MPDANRTRNPQLRRLVLYPVELRARRISMIFSVESTKVVSLMSKWISNFSRQPPAMGLHGCTIKITKMLRYFKIYNRTMLKTPINSSYHSLNICTNLES